MRRKLVTSPLAIMLLLMLVPTLANALPTADPWLPTARLVEPNAPPVSSAYCPVPPEAYCGYSRADFGAAVAIAGNTAFVGQPHEAAVHLFTQVAATWIPMLRLEGPESFGTRLAASHDVAAVAAPAAGMVQLIEHGASGWFPTLTLDKPDGGCFGASIDVAGGRLAVGDPCRSRIHVFERDTAWTEVATLSLPDVEGLGVSLALHDGTLAAAAFDATFLFEQANEDWHGTKISESMGALALAGDVLAVSQYESVHIYEQHDGSWAFVTALEPSDASPFAGSGRFGWSLALEQDTLVVGAPRDDSFSDREEGSGDMDIDCVSQAGTDICVPPRPGAAYVFERSPTGWKQNTKLIGDPVGKQRFGTSVAISDDTILVGAPYKQEAGIGGPVDVDPEDSVHVFSQGVF